MARKAKSKPDDPKQSQRFVETARRLEADESGKSFVGAMKVIALPPLVRAKPRKKTDHPSE